MIGRSADFNCGIVQYLSQKDAYSKRLIMDKPGPVYIGVDYTTANPNAGRESVRLTSKESYDVGTLFVADIAHMVHFPSLLFFK